MKMLLLNRSTTKDDYVYLTLSDVTSTLNQKALITYKALNEIYQIEKIHATSISKL